MLPLQFLSLSIGNLASLCSFLRLGSVYDFYLRHLDPMQHKQKINFLTKSIYINALENITKDLNIPKSNSCREKPNQSCQKPYKPTIFYHDDSTLILGTQMAGVLKGQRLKLSLSLSFSLSRSFRLWKTTIN